MENVKELAEVFGPWGAIILFVIYLIYQTLKERGKLKKEKLNKSDEMNFKNMLKKQMEETSNVNKELLRYLKAVSEKYIEEVNESQARIVIESIFNCSESDVKNYVLKTVRDNHIMGQEREVTAKLRTYISNRFHKDSLLLKEFKYSGKTLSESMKDEWREYIISNVTELVINQRGEKSIISTLENSYDSFKCEMLDNSL